MKKISLIILAILLIVPTQAQAEKSDQGEQVCFADAYGVRRHSPEAWPSWTLRMPGHAGEKCWFASSRGAVKERHSGHATKKVKQEQKPPKIKIADLEPNHTTIHPEVQQTLPRPMPYAPVTTNTYVELMWPDKLMESLNIEDFNPDFGKWILSLFN